ncbi:MAG: SAM-dependent methyltransferase [Pseudomonadota bacterium]
MNTRVLVLLVILMLAGCSTGGGWRQGDLRQAIAAIPERTPEDQARYSQRKPAEVLSFIGVKPGDRVIDILASGGWYSEVLSAAVGQEGLVYAQNPPRLLQFRDGFYEKQLVARLANNRLPNIFRLDANFSDLNIEPESLDAAMLALNFHDLYYLMGPEVAESGLRTIHGLLKPGGVLALIDHHGGQNDHSTNEAAHRINQALVEQLAVSNGFRVAATSEVLRNSDDDYSKNVFDESVKGRTDRFVLKLVK